ncbi:ATP-binding protein [Microbacterium foliorum]
MSTSFRVNAVIQGGGHAPGQRILIEEGSHSGATHLTAITGRNGVGKSRLLSDIAAVFEAISGSKPRSGVEATVEYQFGRSRCTATLNQGKVLAEVDGARVDPSRLPGPKRVAAVTTSAFDKFQIPRSQNGRTDPDPSSPYRYLGLKDSRGRISATAGLYRALDALFDSIASDEQHRSRVSEVFSDLGYEARIEVAYGWTSLGEGLVKSGADLDQVEYSAFSKHAQEEPDSWFGGERPDARQPLVRELAQAVELIGELSTGREGALVADFQNPGVARLDHLRAARLLRRADMIRTKRVTLTRSNTGQRLNIKDASSGEISLVTSMLGIASAIDDQSLILIDEPEISLHPEWQSGYVNRLLASFDRYKECHFLVATHSPLIIAGLPELYSNIVSLEREIDDDFAGGRSLDEALVRVFGVAGPDNLFVKQSLVRALRMASDGSYRNPEFSKLMNALKTWSSATDAAPGVLAVIADLEATVARASRASR